LSAWLWWGKLIGSGLRPDNKEESMSQDVDPKAAVAGPTFLREPYSEEDLRLSRESEAFLSSLNESVRPQQLAERFPRIVNKLTTLWRRPMQLDEYFDELIIDKRGNRQGFPLSILMELTNLKEHFETAFPVRSNVWNGGAANGEQRS
jgi:hypothetical protein